MARNWTWKSRDLWLVIAAGVTFAVMIAYGLWDARNATDATDAPADVPTATQQQQSGETDAALELISESDNRPAGVR